MSGDFIGGGFGEAVVASVVFLVKAGLVGFVIWWMIRLLSVLGGAKQ